MVQVFPAQDTLCLQIFWNKSVLCEISQQISTRNCRKIYVATIFVAPRQLAAGEVGSSEAVICHFEKGIGYDRSYGLMLSRSPRSTLVTNRKKLISI